MSRFIATAVFVAVTSAPLIMAQSTINGSRDISGYLRVKGTTATVQSGSALPATCNPGPPADVFIRTADSTYHYCSASNVWTAITDGGGVLTAGQITNTPAGNVSATTVQGAINELDSEKAAASHTHSAADIASGTFAAQRLPVMAGDGGSGGALGAVPAPAAGDAAAGKYLKADGTWTVPPTGGGGGSPGGGSGQIQINDGGVFGGRSVGLGLLLDASNLGIDTAVVPQKGSANAWTQTNSFNGAVNGTGSLDASGFTSTKPMKTGSTDPATCSEGEKFYNTTSHAEKTCTATNTWTTTGGGLGDPGGNGLVARTALNTTTSRTIQGTANEVSVANGDGVSANPVISLASTVDLSGKITLPIQAGTSANAPATCVANKQLYIKTDATAGQQVFICNGAGNGWVLVGDGGSGGGGGISSSSGTYASRPSTCTTGDLYIYTDSFYTQARCTSTNTWTNFINGKQITDPVDSDFAWVNQGSATTSTTNGGIHLTTPAASGSHLHIRKKSAPTQPYTIETIVLPMLSQRGASQYPTLDFGFRESGTGKLVSCGMYRSGASNGGGAILAALHYASADSSATVAYQEAYFPTFGPLRLRAEHDGTNLKCHVSVDGINWQNYWSETKTTYLTTDADEVFFSVNPNGSSSNASATLLHWKQL